MHLSHGRRTLATAAAAIGTLVAACGGDSQPAAAPSPTGTVVPTAETRPEPEACTLLTPADVQAATNRPVTTTLHGTKRRSSQADDLVSFCNFLSQAVGEVVAQITWGRRPDAQEIFKAEKPANARDLPGLGTAAYQNSFGVAVILVEDSLLSVSVPGFEDQAAALSATLELANKLAARAR